jgi:hypothetical protein
MIVMIYTDLFMMFNINLTITKIKKFSQKYQALRNKLAHILLLSTGLIFIGSLGGML